MMTDRRVRGRVLILYGLRVRDRRAPGPFAVATARSRWRDPRAEASGDARGERSTLRRYDQLGRRAVVQVQPHEVLPPPPAERRTSHRERRVMSSPARVASSISRVAARRLRAGRARASGLAAVDIEHGGGPERQREDTRTAVRRPHRRSAARRGATTLLEQISPCGEIGTLTGFVISSRASARPFSTPPVSTSREKEGQGVERRPAFMNEDPRTGPRPHMSRITKSSRTVRGTGSLPTPRHWSVACPRPQRVSPTAIIGGLDTHSRPATFPVVCLGFHGYPRRSCLRRQAGSSRVRAAAFRRLRPSIVPVPRRYGWSSGDRWDFGEQRPCCGADAVASLGAACRRGYFNVR